MTDTVFKPKKNCEYSKAEDVEEIVQHMKDVGMFPNLQIDKMAFIRSKKKEKKEKKYTNDEAGKIQKDIDDLKSKRKFIARCHTTSKFWSEIYGDKTIYFCVEIASECYDDLSLNDKLYTIIHELHHIPSDFTVGRMVQHDEFKVMGQLLNKYKDLNKDNDGYKLE